MGYLDLIHDRIWYNCSQLKLDMPNKKLGLQCEFMLFIFYCVSLKPYNHGVQLNRNMYGESNPKPINDTSYLYLIYWPLDVLLKHSEIEALSNEPLFEWSV